jgi:hypothetical protein
MGIRELTGRWIEIDAEFEEGEDGAPEEGEDLLAEIRTIIEPTPAWHETVDGRALFQEVVSTISRYVIMTNPAYTDVCAAWVIATGFRDTWTAFAHLVPTSPVPDSGKSNLRATVAALCNSSVESGRTRAAWLTGVYTVNQSPMLAIDEMDSFAARDPDLMADLTASFDAHAAYYALTVEDPVAPTGRAAVQLPIWVRNCSPVANGSRRRLPRAA